MRMLSPRRAAFTLIELLVVVAVIALLAALLLPALKNARNKAKSIACLSNLHQVALATVGYSGDYNGYPPGVRDLYPGDYQTVAWTQVTAWSTYQGPIGVGQLYAGGYIKNGRVFFCPGRTEGDRLTATWSGSGEVPWSQFGQGGWVHSSYYLASANISTYTGLNVGSWHRFGVTDSSKPLAFDYCLMASVAPTFTAWMPYGTSRHTHGPGYNFVFFDGSARFVKDPGNALEYMMPTWIFLMQADDSNPICYLHRKLFGWADHTRK